MPYTLRKQTNYPPEVLGLLQYPGKFRGSDLDVSRPDEQRTGLGGLWRDPLEDEELGNVSLNNWNQPEQQYWPFPVIPTPLSKLRQYPVSPLYPQRDTASGAKH